MLVRTNTFINSVGALAPALPATTTSLASSLNPSQAGVSVTFTATVTGAAASSGTVMFYDAGVAISSAIPLSGSTATFANSSLVSGIHSITAMYSGDASHGSSVSNAVLQDVRQFTTTTTMSAAPEPSSAGASVTLTATVTGTPASPVPTGGTVTFKDVTGGVDFLITSGGDNLTTGAGDFLVTDPSPTSVDLGTASMSGGTATLVVPSYFASNGSYILEAVYSGSTGWTGSDNSAALYTHTVSAATGDYTTGLIHFYPMTDAQVSGVTINDIGSSPSNGTAAGLITSVAGPNATYTTARAADGASGSVIDLNASAFNWNSGSFTVACWIYIVDLSTTQTLMYDDRTGDGSNFIRIANAGSTNAGKVFNNTSSTRFLTTAAEFPAATWCHLTYVNSGGGAAGTQGIYINAASKAASSSPANDSFSATGTHNVFAGTAGASNLNGRMCALRVYNRALSAADVTALFTAGG